MDDDIEQLPDLGLELELLRSGHAGSEGKSEGEGEKGDKLAKRRG
jgi:hypothetical protein